MTRPTAGAGPARIGGGAYLGAGILADSLWVLALVIPVLLIIHFGVVLREEAYLAMKFGEAYQDYARVVRRWL